MTKRRKVASLLLLAWLLLAAGPVVFAATGKCCPVCTQNMCPMKKAPHAGSMTCHDTMTRTSCHLQAGACSGELDGLVFSFLAIIPAVAIFAPYAVTKLTPFERKTSIQLTAHKLIPPPKVLFA